MLVMVIAMLIKLFSRRGSISNSGGVVMQVQGVPKKKAAIKTRPSILCVTQKRAFMPLYIVLGHQRACMHVYIGKSGDLVG